MIEPRLGLRDVMVARGGRVILQIDSLDVFPRQVLAVVGPNGAGKSTLVNVLALLERAGAGRVLFDGLPVGGSRLAYRRRMAVVFQEPLLLDTTVEGNVGSGLALRKVPPAERGARVRLWLERFGIAHLARRSARTLSGGEAQRTSLARALALDPDALLLDEPFSALDPPTRESLIDDLDRVLVPSEMATVFVTHDRSEALRLGDRLAVMMGGRIRQVGAPGEVFGAPADEEVAAFTGVETIVPGRVRCAESGLSTVKIGDRLVEGAGEFAPGAEVLFCLRPEDVVLAPPSSHPEETSARNHLPATVRRVLAAGPYVRVEVDCGFPLIALISKQSLEQLELAPGSAVTASFKAMAVHFIARHQNPAT